jgi:uncharacterized protein (DUF2252 family)
MARFILDKIQNFNSDRTPERVRLKFERMSMDSFAFFRGTCHLFYEDWPAQSVLNSAPLVWVCGDLHMMNFGSYKGDNRLVYFDMNDFDEAVLAPCTWDLARFLTSVWLACRNMKLADLNASNMCQAYLRAYTAALSDGKARVVEAATAEGIVKELLDAVAARKRKDFVEKRTEKKDGQRHLILDGKHTAPVTLEERERVLRHITSWAERQVDPGFFKVLDVAHRIAGVGSLGVDRYLLLVEGKGSPDQNYLIDLKEEKSSSLHPYLRWPQPAWTNEAERVAALQHRVQGTSPALLAPLQIEDKPYLMHELQPDQDKVDLTQWEEKPHRLEKLMETMGKVTAWGQLRSSGRQGSSIADELISFAMAPDWHEELLNYAKQYASQAEADYQQWCSSLKKC